MSNMYADAKTWNPFKGCEFDCSYCKPSFQAQAKRQKHNCKLCYDYKPHVHPDRLTRIPKAKIVFACGNGDVAFAEESWRQAFMDVAAKRPEQTFYFQSKKPSCFEGLNIPENVVLVTTLETDIDQLVRDEVSATVPLPSERFEQFKRLSHKRKIVTIEPIMQFNQSFRYWIYAINPERVWIGYNSRPKAVQLTEPFLYETLLLIEQLREKQIYCTEKTMRQAIQS